MKTIYLDVVHDLSQMSEHVYNDRHNILLLQKKGKNKNQLTHKMC